MSSRWRRFEVLLPLQFNDGRDVPAEWLADAVLEVVQQFGVGWSLSLDGRNRSAYRQEVCRSAMPKRGSL